MTKKRQKHKHKRPHPQAAKAPVGDPVAAINAYLTSGRARRAWALAKTLGSEELSDEAARQAVLAAWQARVSEILADNHPQEAVAMHTTLFEQHPELAAELPIEFTLKMELLGASGKQLASLTDEQQATLLPPLLFDVPALAAHSSLAAEHPLRQQAQLVVAAWQEVEIGAAAAAYERLRQIPRRSALSDWRLFVQALEAFYQGDDATALANCQRISSTSAAAAAALVIHRAIADDTAQSPVENKLRKQLISIDSSYNLAELQAMLDADKSPRQIFKAIEQIGSNLTAHGHHQLALDAATGVFTCFAQKDVEPPSSIRSDNAFLGKNLVRILLRIRYAFDPIYDQYVAFTLTQEHKQLSAIDKAVLCREVAIMHIGENFEDEKLPDYLDKDDSENLAVILHWFHQSLEFLPLDSTFATLYNFVSSSRKLKTQTAEILHDWLKAFPASTTALQAGIAVERRAGNFQAAQTLLEQLQSQQGQSPTTQRLRLLLTLEHAVKRAPKSPAEAQKMLAEAPKIDDIFSQVATAATGWIVADGNRKLRIDYSNQLAKFEQPLLVIHCLRHFLPEFAPSQLPAAVKKQWQRPEIICTSLATLLSIDDPLWRPQNEMPLADFLRRHLNSNEPDLASALLALQAMYNADPHQQLAGVDNIAFILTRVALQQAQDNHDKALSLGYRAWCYVSKPAGNTDFFAKLRAYQNHSHAAKLLQAATQLLLECPAGTTIALLEQIADNNNIKLDSANKLAKKQLNELYKQESRCRTLGEGVKLPDLGSLLQQANKGDLIEAFINDFEFDDDDDDFDFDESFFDFIDDDDADEFDDKDFKIDFGDMFK